MVRRNLRFFGIRKYVKICFIVHCQDPLLKSWQSAHFPKTFFHLIGVIAIYSLDEMAQFDVPAAIDKVLEISGQRSLYFMGSSQGTLDGFMTLAELPAYNSKVIHKGFSPERKRVV